MRSMARWGMMLAATAAMAGPASAHGPRPRAERILLDPADPDFVYIVANVFGHYRSLDGGVTYGWICSDYFAGNNVIDNQPTINAVLAGSDRRVILVAGNGGLFRTEDDGCTWERVEGLWGSQRIGHVQIDPADPDHLLATTTQGGDTIDNGLYESFDAGRRWQAMSLRGPHFYRTVMIHAGTGRIYVTSFEVAAQVYYLHRSDDGGATWMAFALPNVGTRSYRIVDVDPDDPDVVYLRAQSSDGDIFLRVTEGGARAEVTLQPELAAFLYELAYRDGALYLGRDGGGAYVSEDGGRTWMDGPTEPGMFCFHPYGEDLYACADQLRDRRGASVSRDGGRTWSEFFRYEQNRGPMSCPNRTTWGDVCDAERWERQQEEYAEWCLNGYGENNPACGLDGGDDGGKGRGGSCAQADGSVPAGVLLLLAAGGWMRLRRGKAPETARDRARHSGPSRNSGSSSTAS